MKQVIRIICFAPANSESFVTNSALAASTGYKRIRTVSTIGRFVTLFIPPGEMIIQLPGNTQREEKPGILLFQRLQSDGMADNTRLVLIAVDDCDHSERAFDCEQEFLFASFESVSVDAIEHEITIVNTLPVDNFVPGAVKTILFVFLLALTGSCLAKLFHFSYLFEKSLNGKETVRSNDNFFRNFVD